MDESNRNQIEKYYKIEIIRLNFKGLVLKSACKKFDLSLNDALSIYQEVRRNMKKSLSMRAWTYLLLGSIIFGVGLFGTLSKTGYIFYGALASGFGMLFTSIGYFRISLLKS